MRRGILALGHDDGRDAYRREAVQHPGRGGHGLYGGDGNTGQRGAKRSGGRQGAAGRGRSRGAEGGRGSGRGGRCLQLGDHECPDLPTLMDVVAQHAGGWAATGQLSPLRAAFSHAPKLGMRPGEEPRDEDPARLRLLSEVLATLAEYYVPLLPRLQDTVGCTIPLWACAKAGYWEGGLAAALLARLAQGGGEILRQAKGQAHSNLWWALSQAPKELLVTKHAEAALSASAELLQGYRSSGQQASDLSAQACSNVLIAAARLQYSQGTLLHNITACLVSILPGSDNQAVANSLYALGKLAEECGHAPRREDLQLLAAAVLERLEGRNAGARLDAMELSHTLWACAKLGYTDAALLRPLAAATGRIAGDMNAHDLANTLYAMGELGCTGPEYVPTLQALAGAAVSRLNRRPAEFADQALSNILWAMATLQPPCSAALVRAAAEECQRRGLSSFQPRCLSNAVWALAKTCGGENALLEEGSVQAWYAEAVVAAMQPGFIAAANAQDWSNLLYALAVARHPPPAALLDGMAASEQLRASASEQACTNCLWALARLFGNLGCYGPMDAITRDCVLRLAGVLAARMGALLQASGSSLLPTHFCTTLWALAEIGQEALSRHGGLVEGLLREVVRRWEAGQGASFNRANLSQLWHVQLELQHMEREHAGSSARLSDILAGYPGLTAAARLCAPGLQLRDV